MKRNKGITLIALIITIIVMLILVAVSVNVLIKSNLIGTAENTVDKYKTASEEEAKGGTIEINGKKYASIEEYIKEKEGITEIHNWERTGDDLTCNHCNRTVTIGQELDYKDNGKGTSSISAEKAGGSSEIVESMLNSGIKIASLNLKETLKIAASGPEPPTTTQTINKDAETKWVVLGAEDVNKNGTNETLLLTTKTPTTEKIFLYGAGGYNNCIEEINRMCREIYGEEAEGMTIKDVNNCLAYTPAGGMYNLYGWRTSWNTTGNLNTKLKNLGEMWTKIKDYNTNSKSGVFYDPSHPEGIKDNGATLGEYELNGYYYSVSNDGTYLVNKANTSDTSNTITTATKNVIFGSDNSNRYWLASRGVFADSYYAGFGPGAVNEGVAYSYNGLFRSGGASDGGEFPLRAVVSLRSDIPAVVE